MEPMVKVKVIKDFRDREAELVLRKPEEIFETRKSRADQLIAKGFVERILEEAPAAEAPKPAAKKASKKK